MGCLYDGVLMTVTVLPTWYFFIVTHSLEMLVSFETMNISSEEIRIGIKTPTIQCLNTLL